MGLAVLKNNSADRFRNNESKELPMQESIPIDIHQKRFMPVEEASDYMGLSVYYIRQGIKSGWIPHIRCGNKAMINIAKLIDILDTESVNGKCR